MDDPAPPRIARIAATIAVTDIDRALRFYRDLIGLEVAFTNGDPVGFVILRRDGAEVHLTRDPRHVATANNVAHLLVDDVDGLCRRLESGGARIVKGVRDKDFGLRACVVADFDGNRLDLGQPLRPSA